MVHSNNSRAASIGDAFFTASRQVWLAGLGAAVVTRDWAEKEASTVFRNLVREGTTVESRAFRVVGDRLGYVVHAGQHAVEARAPHGDHDGQGLRRHGGDARARNAARARCRASRSKSEIQAGASSGTAKRSRKVTNSRKPAKRAQADGEIAGQARLTRHRSREQPGSRAAGAHRRSDHREAARRRPRARGRRTAGRHLRGGRADRARRFAGRHRPQRPRRLCRRVVRQLRGRGAGERHFACADVPAVHR